MQAHLMSICSVPGAALTPYMHNHIETDPELGTLQKHSYLMSEAKRGSRSPDRKGKLGFEFQ